MPNQLDRNAFHRRFKSLISGFSSEYRNIAESVSGDVMAQVNRGVSPSRAVNDAWARYKVDPAIRASIEDKIVDSACYGYGIMPTVGVNREGIKSALLAEAWTPDKMKLSTRLHGASRQMRSDITDTISRALQTKTSWVQLARQLYDGYGYGNTIEPAEVAGYLQRMMKHARQMGGFTSEGIDRETLRAIQQAQKKISELKTPGLRAAYQNLLDKTLSASDRQMVKAVEFAIEEKSRYYAERIARTEIARAYGEGFESRITDDSDVVGIKWNLSADHRIFDICDFHADTDNFGMGAGVYPKNRYPEYPAHPHCTCSLLEVFEGEATPGRRNPNEGAKYLRSLPKDKRKELIGVEGRPDNWERELRNYQGYSKPSPVVPPELFEN